MFFEQDDGFIDYDKRTPYTIQRIEFLNGKKYKVIYTVRKGVADSRIVTSIMVKIGD